jgi:7-cyano-7-deazaguanine reductase
MRPSRNTRGLRLLGSSETGLPLKPDARILETFPNPSPGARYTVSLECGEFTSMCPVTGQPDFAAISIQYIPAARCIETKSLKFYLAAYRHVRGFNEEVVNSILRDFVKACRPRWVRIRGEFVARGGIRLAVEAESPAPRNSGRSA